MQIDNKRLAEQQKIVQKWIDSKAKGTVVGPTGFGKSFVGVLAIQQMNSRHPLRSALIIVPTVELKKQWEKHIKTHELVNSTVMVVNTAIRKKYDCHLLVLDEIHRYAANTFQKVFNQVKYHFILGLTATFTRNDMKHYLVERHCPVLFEMTLQEAKDKSYVSDFDLYNLSIPLTLTDKITYDDLDHKFNYYFSWFEHDFHKVKLCLDDQTYCSHYAAKTGVTPQEVKVKAINFFRVMGKRKMFLYGNSSKLRLVKEILEKYPQKAIVFAETTEFADSVTQVMGESCRSAHTGIPNKQRDENLKEFADPDSKVRILSTSKMFDEGIDLPDIEIAIIASGTSSKRQSIQRIGRAIRKKAGKKAMIVNLYIKNSQEMKWVEKRTLGLQAQWIEDLQQIGTEQGVKNVYGIGNNIFVV